MDAGADFLVYDRQKQLVLAVEAKTVLNTSVEWAKVFRRNILAHGILPKIQFFLIATPDRLFVWKDIEDTSAMSEPTKVIDSKPFFGPYFERTGIAPENIGGWSFDLMVNSWLSKLVYFGLLNEQTNGPYQQLIEIGLHDAIRGGDLAPEAIA